MPAAVHDSDHGGGTRMPRAPAPAWVLAETAVPNQRSCRWRAFVATFRERSQQSRAGRRLPAVLSPSAPCLISRIAVVRSGERQPSQVRPSAIRATGRAGGIRQAQHPAPAASQPGAQLHHHFSDGVGIGLSGDQSCAPSAQRHRDIVEPPSPRRSRPPSVLCSQRGRLATPVALLPALAAARCRRRPAARAPEPGRDPQSGVLVVSAASAAALLRMKPVSASAVARVAKSGQSGGLPTPRTRQSGREQHRTE